MRKTRFRSATASAFGPLLTGNAAPAPRTLFWRFKANQQRAVRDGDYKALKIGANGYLFMSWTIRWSVRT